MKNTKNINIEINKPYFNTITAKQGDNARYLLFNLLDNGVPFILTGRTVRVYATKPDGTKVFNDLTIVNAVNGQAELQLTTQMLAVVGNVNMELVIYEGTSILSTTAFTLEVGATNRSDSAVISTNEFSALVNALANIDDLEANYAPRLNTVESSLSDSTNQSVKCSKTLKKMLYGETVNIIAFGDSITFGRQPGSTNIQVDSQYPYPAVLQTELREIFNNQNINVINKGISGNTSTLLLARIVTDVINLAPDCCIVMTGYNDVGINMNPSDFRANMESLVRQLKIAGIEVILIQTVPNFNDGYNRKISVFNKIVEETASKCNVTLVDLFDTCMERYTNGSTTPFIAQPDNVHFEETHYRIIAEEIINSAFGFLKLEKHIKSNQRVYIPVVNSPHIVNNIPTKIWVNSRIRTGRSFYLQPSTSDFLNFPFIIKQKNVRLKIVVQKAYNGGNINVYDSGVLLKNVSCKSPGTTTGGLIDNEIVLIENLSVGYHCIQLEGANINTDTIYVSEFIFETDTKERGSRVDYSFSGNSPQTTFYEISKIFDNRVRFTNLISEGNGTLNRESKSLELITSKTLIMEFTVRAMAGVGVSWFGSILNYNGATQYQLSNLGYLIYFTSTSEVRVFKSDYTGSITGITPYITGLTLDFTKDIKIRIEHSSIGVINIYFDDVLIKNFTDTDYNNGHCGCYSQVANASIDIKDSSYYYV